MPRFDIFDDVHGVVYLEEHERVLVDSPWFQRLRHIRQLSLASMVFPGATHNRFAHSIGVLHLASRMAERLDLDGQDLSELRAAALLHDIGHFPFSHTIEEVYEEAWMAAAQPPQPMEQGGAEGPAPADDFFAGMPPKADFHEKMSAKVIRETDVQGGITRILKEASLSPKRVASVVVGGHSDFLLNQVLKSDLDVDQMDYLLRDAKATGSSYGQYDLDYLMECIGTATVQGQRVLCVHSKGLYPLEYYVLAKQFYYLCVLYQRTRCIIEGLLRAIVEDLIECSAISDWAQVSARFADPFFYGFDDHYVWTAIRSASEGEGVGQDTRDAIDMLLQRRLPRLGLEMHVLVPKSDLCFLPPDLPEDVNSTLKRAIRYAGHQKFEVLEGPPGRNPAPEELLASPGPIRLLLPPTFNLTPGTPYLTADDEGERIVLLGSLKDTVVGRLAGQTTHVLRHYHP